MLTECAVKLKSYVVRLQFIFPLYKKGHVNKDKQR